MTGSARGATPKAQMLFMLSPCPGGIGRIPGKWGVWGQIGGEVEDLSGILRPSADERRCRRRKHVMDTMHRMMLNGLFRSHLAMQ
ncbi:hypothetical protein GCM10010357_47210 [Streptomyces luteireticuli]|uniref:Uncharacterized protein n=1 Tax=Streptomyces luteireticuli TaxID=173858 RepID=A0ABN0YY72_9ACTN